MIHPSTTTTIWDEVNARFLNRPGSDHTLVEIEEFLRSRLTTAAERRGVDPPRFAVRFAPVEGLVYRCPRCGRRGVRASVCLICPPLPPQLRVPVRTLVADRSRIEIFPDPYSDEAARLLAELMEAEL